MTVFLEADWRHLALLNYTVDPELLRPLVPFGTELDDFEGRTYVSVVGFLFRNTRVLGVRVPFVGSFEEVNLRFYVRRRAEDGWRRAVTFVKEVVPYRVVALVARRLYGERYCASPMAHRVTATADGGAHVRYSWRHAGEEQRIELEAPGPFEELPSGSAAEFIAEHYYGYAAQEDGGTVEYRVEHPVWRACAASSAALRCDVEEMYGARFVEPLAGEPASAFLAEGSRVKVHRGERLRS